MHAGRTAAEIAADVRAGRARAVEVVGEHLDRIGEVDPGLGAFQLVRAESALAEAAVVDARADRPGLPLAGVPVAVKDNVPVTGEPMRGAAGPARRGRRPTIIWWWRGCGRRVRWWSG